jgi:hypothetical protein
MGQGLDGPGRNDVAAELAEVQIATAILARQLGVDLTGPIENKLGRRLSQERRVRLTPAEPSWPALQTHTRGRAVTCSGVPMSGGVSQEFQLWIVGRSGRWRALTCWRP